MKIDFVRPRYINHKLRTLLIQSLNITRMSSYCSKLANNHKVWFCLLGNIITMILVLTIVCIFRDDESKYFRFGPQPDLIVISIRIDTWNKWLLLNFFIGLVKGCDVLVNELGSPILGFRVYNPDKLEIDDFTKNELNFLANAMWFTNGFRTILMSVITITQIDIAFSGMIISELVSIGTVRHLLNGKKFTKIHKPVFNDDDLDKETDDKMLLLEVV